MNSVMEVNSLRHVAIPCIGYTILAAVGSQKPRSSVYSRTIVSTQYCYKRGLDLYRSQRFNQSRCVGRNRFRDTPVNILTRRYRCNFYGTAFLFSLASSEAPGGGKKREARRLAVTLNTRSCVYCIPLRFAVSRPPLSTSDKTRRINNELLINLGPCTRNCGPALLYDEPFRPFASVQKSERNCHIHSQLSCKCL